MYTGCHTAFDVMKEYLILGAELDGEYQIPIVPACNLETLPEDSVDFEDSFSRKIKKFTRLFNNPDKSTDHLKCFHSVTMPDFSIATGSSGMPFALNIYNKYRNHALAWYLHMQGITVIPSVSIADKDNYDWCFDGYPMHSILSVCTNGRVRSKAARLEFCDGFKAMCYRLEPTQVIVVGKIPDELNTDVKIINFKTRNQKINEEMSV